MLSLTSLIDNPLSLKKKKTGNVEWSLSRIFNEISGQISCECTTAESQAFNNACSKLVIFYDEINGIVLKYFAFPQWNLEIPNLITVPASTVNIFHPSQVQ